MNAATNIVCFAIIAVLISVFHFATSGDMVIVSATGGTKFHLSAAEKWLESALIGTSASALLIALFRIARHLRK